MKPPTNRGGSGGRSDGPRSGPGRGPKAYAGSGHSGSGRPSGAGGPARRGDKPGADRAGAAQPAASPFGKARGGKPASGSRDAGPSRTPYRPAETGSGTAERRFPPATPRVPGRQTLTARPVAPRPAEENGERPPARPRERATADTPSGALWLYGHHAVAAALANPARRLRRLLLTEEAEAALAARLPQPWPVARERAERARLDQLLGRDTVHQGAALLADPLAAPPLAEAMERPGPVLVLDQVSDPRNIGAILRSAAAFGAAMVITQDRHTPQETGALAKAASGALETVVLLRAVNLARTLVALKAAGCWVVGLDAGAAPPLSGAALAGRRVALVLGAEGSGLRRLTRETCDEIASLAMPGVMESLNVAAAASVALYELRRG